jgi:hypothetical protein
MKKYITPDMKEYQLLMANMLCSSPKGDEPPYGGAGGDDDDPD